MGGPTTVLVVDDDAGIRDSLVECLEAEGFQVMAAQNGEEALLQLRARRPSLVVVDLFMPVMNGAQFLAQLREDASTRDLPVVLMTGAVPRAGQQLPVAQAVLPKPFELEELIETVRRLA